VRNAPAYNADQSARTSSSYSTTCAIDQIRAALERGEHLTVKERLASKKAIDAISESASSRQFADEVLHSDDLFPKEFCVTGFLALWKQNLKRNEPLYCLPSDRQAAKMAGV